ncbi:MAG: hypothetical protein ACTSWX_08200 [Promethearchaeota archaeon]
MSFSVVFLDENLKIIEKYLETEKSIKEINKELEAKTNITQFFRSKADILDFRNYISSLLNNKKIESNSRQDLGDFQTPPEFTDDICKCLFNQEYNPEILFEPTCGEGNFIISALKIFSNLKKIFCTDLQPDYEWLFKLKILKLSSEINFQAKIEFYRLDIFSIEFLTIFGKLEKYSKNELLVIGNPPWITNTGLSKLNSKNIPKKTNYKQINGINALTGKSNFDIAEYIMRYLLQNLIIHKLRGKFVFLLKDTVIQNLMIENHRSSLRLANNFSFQVNFKKIFKISAHGSLFISNFGNKTEYICIKKPFDDQIKTDWVSFGWYNDKFVSNIENYKKLNKLDGKSPKIWRQGVKHDLSKVMILRTDSDGNLVNGYDEIVDVEDKFIYPFLKSSDLKEKIAKKSRYQIIITQHKLGQDTTSFKITAPKLWFYLNQNLDKFNARKSKIYHNKPLFSIFGIGDYTFKPYKIGVSGFYKKLNFCLITPQNSKTVILDDTSYFLFFDDLLEAFFTWTFLNFPESKEFLESISFITAKRPYTKEILMRLNYEKIVEKCSFSDFQSYYRDNLEKEIKVKFNKKDFVDFKDKLKNLNN